MTALAAVMSSAAMDWRTPPNYMALVHQLGPVTFDPFAGPGWSCVNAEREWWGPNPSRDWRECLSFNLYCVGIAATGTDLRWPDYDPWHDAFTESWEWRGLSHVNPVYGSELDRAVAKIAAEGFHAYMAGDRELVCLVASRTDTARFHDHLMRGHAVCFLRKRLAFRRPDGTCGPGAAFPSLVTYWGRRPYRFAEVFEQAGTIVLPRKAA